MGTSQSRRIKSLHSEIRVKSLYKAHTLRDIPLRHAAPRMVDRRDDMGDIYGYFCTDIVS